MTDTPTRQINGTTGLPAIPAAPALLPDADRAGRIIEEVVAAGDLSKLDPRVRARWYVALCQSLGLNPMTQPFAYITVQGKMVLYPNKGATDQLGRAHKVDVETISREKFEDLWIVTVKARTPDGRTTEEIGAVPIAGKSGDDLANALMKAQTKAKRRAVLSHVGLGWLEPERDTDAEPVYADRHGNVATRQRRPERTLAPATQAELDALATDEPPQANARAIIPDDQAGAVSSSEEPSAAAPSQPPTGTSTAPAEHDAEASFRELVDDTAEQPPAEGFTVHSIAWMAKRAEADALIERCKVAGITPGALHPQATELALDQFIAMHTRMLNARLKAK